MKEPMTCAPQRSTSSIQPVPWQNPARLITMTFTTHSVILSEERSEEVEGSAVAFTATNQLRKRERNHV